VPLATDEELARFPRTAFMIAGMDMFRDDGLIFAEKLKTLG
jgi:acetyl esterase/lipase